MSSIFLFGGVAGLGALLNLAAWIWLVVCAFKTEKRWGWLLLGPTLIDLGLSALGLGIMGIVLAPVSLGLTIAFVVKAWAKARQPFFLYLAGLVICILGGVGLVVSGTMLAKAQLEKAGQGREVQVGRTETPADMPAPERPQFSRPPAVTSDSATSPVARRRTRPPGEMQVARANPAAPRPASTERTQSVSVSPTSADSGTTEKTDILTNQPLSSAHASTGAASSEPDPRSAPLSIDSKRGGYDPQLSLQTVTLSLSNSSPKAIRSVRMNLIYIDRDGVKTKGWMTSRELDRVLGAGQGTELEQPAYFMPALTKRVAVEVKNVRFEDGTEWSGQ